MSETRSILNNINNGVAWDAWTPREQNIFALSFMDGSIRNSQNHEEFESERNKLSLKLFNRLNPEPPAFILSHLKEHPSLACDKPSLVMAGELRALLLAEAKRRNPRDERIN